MKSKTLITGILVVLLSFCFVSLATARWLNVPFFSQRNGPWAGDPVGTCSEKMHQIGCAVTSAAMVLKYYGVNVDPGRLNTWLTRNGGYRYGCEINWSRAADYSTRVLLETAYNTTSLTAMNRYLDNNQPVIAKVYGSRGQHFVVVICRYGSNYYIQDPWDTYPGCKSLRAYSNRIYQIAVYASSCRRAPGKNFKQSKLATTTWAEIKR